MSRYLAIDIDSAGLCVAAGIIRGPAAAIERTLVWEDAQLPLTPASAAGLGERFRDALKSAEIAPAPLLVGLGRDRVILKELRYPPVPAAEEPAVIRFQAMKDLSESPDEVVLDYVPQPGVGGERRSTAFVLKKEYYQAIQTFASAAGLKLAGVTPRPFAVSAALRRAIAVGSVPAPPRADDAIAVMHVGPHGGEFSVFRGEQVTFTRTISVPAANPEALTAEVKRNLVVYGGPSASQPVAALYVAEVETPGHAGRLRSALSVPVHGFDPLADASTAVPADAAGRFAGAIGLLALRAAADLPINFAAPRQPKHEADPTRRAVLLAALACAILLAFGAVYGFLESARASNRLAQAQSNKKIAETELALLEVDSKRLQATDDWSKREVVWLDEMYDLFSRFNDINRARISSITTQALPVDKAGKQPAQARLEVSLNASSAEPVNALLSAFDRDNHGKTKHYVNPTKAVLGTASGTNAGALNLLFRISTLVNHRGASEFTRSIVASAPPAPGKSRVEAPPIPEPPAAGKTATTTTTTTPPAKGTDPKAPGYKAPNFNDDWFIK